MNQVTSLRVARLSRGSRLGSIVIMYTCVAYVTSVTRFASLFRSPGALQDTVDGAECRSNFEVKVYGMFRSILLSHVQTEVFSIKI